MRVTGLNVSIMTQYEYVSRLATAIIVALVVILLQCLVSVYHCCFGCDPPTMLGVSLSTSCKNKVHCVAVSVSCEQMENQDTMYLDLGEMGVH